MQEYQIIEYGQLSSVQKEQVVGIFIEGFGHMMTFSRDKNELREIFLQSIHPSLFVAYVEQGNVLGILGLATNRVRPLKFDREACVKVYGKKKGSMVCKQMNSIFQKPAVKGERDLYVDTLATAGSARGKGVGTALLNYAFESEGYDTYYIEVFSKNETAARLYRKLGFVVCKEEKLSPMRLLGFGYPVKMRKEKMQ